MTMDYPATIEGESLLFEAVADGKVKYDHNQKSWFVYRNGYWEQDGTEITFEFCREVAHKRLDLAMNLPDGEDRRRHTVWATRMIEPRHRDETLKAVKSMPSMQRNQWNPDPEVFCVKNGVVNLRTGEFVPHKPEFYCTQQSPVEYDPRAECPKWVNFLQDIFASHPEVIPYIQRAIGYTLSGSVKDQVFFFLYGPTAMNGKTTFLNMLKRLMGSYAGQMNFGSLRATKVGSHNEELAAMSQKRLVVVSEPPQGHKWNDSLVKMVTADTELRTRFMYQGSFEFKPEFKIWVDSNFPIITDDVGEGFWRRPQIIPFDERFDGKRRDLNIELKLAQELPGMLNFAIKGYQEKIKWGFDPPPIVTLSSRTQQRALIKDRIGGVEDFIQECYVRGEYETQGRVLWLDYKDWAKDNLAAKEVLDSRNFSREVVGLGFERKEKSSGVWYHGLTKKFDLGI